MHRALDGSVVVRKLGHDGRDFQLSALNPKFETVPVTGVFVGFLVGVVRETGSRVETVYDQHGLAP